MKSIKTLLLLVSITFSSLLSASTTENAETIAITKDVSQLLKKPKFLLEEDVKVNVTITFNKDNEIVVLLVDSVNEEVAEFIKKRLNYSKLSVELYNKNKMYIVPVKLEVE